MTLLFCLFVLFFIQPAELRPTINDDLPTEEVFDYLIKYGYLSGPNTLKWRQLMASNLKTNESSKRNITVTSNNEDNKRNTTIKNSSKNVFDQEEIETAIVELQTFFKLPGSGKLDEETIKLMKKIRCGNLDISSKNKLINKKLTPRVKRKTEPTQFVEQFYKGRREQTYTWTFVPSRDYGGFYRKYIQYGMNMWAEVANVNFKYIPRTEDTFNIVIRFARKWHLDGNPFDGPGGIVAHTLKPKADSNNPIEIHFDGDETWEINMPDGNGAPFGRTGGKYDFIQEVMHQVGHALGFVHSGKPESVMNPKLIEGRKDALYKLSHEDMQKVKKLKGHCWPNKIDAAFSNTNDGRTYMTKGPFTYQFEVRPKKYLHASVAQTWPRPSANVWYGFELIDEIVIHGDKHTYFFSGNKYTIHLHTADPSKGLLPRYNLGEGVHEKTKRKYTGWPGLKHFKYIDAALMNYTGGQTYIFQDDLVYLWDSTKIWQDQDEYHLPRGNVADGWPKKIKKVFPGVPDKIDSAFHYYYDDKIYFFKDKYFYAWDKVKKKAKGRKPISELWRNVCNVYMCTFTRTDPCRSWNMKRESCGSLCDR